MGQILYQRPREKLRDRGVRALSNTELLQIIISSGSLGVSAARIAKSVVILLEQSNPPPYQDLLKIQGLGHAKVAQVIAAIELGCRYKHGVHTTEPPAPVFLKLKVSSKRTLEYITLDGANKYIQTRAETIADSTKTTLVIRKMFANALHDYASSVVVGIGSRTQRVDMLDSDVLNMVKIIFDTASLLEIKINVVWLVNQTSQQAFRRKAVQ